MKPLSSALLVASTLAASTVSAATSVNLESYRLIGRYALPEPTRVTAPANNLLAQEVSAVTWNRDTNTLFVLGDGGTSVTQVGLTGTLINSMTLGLDASQPQGTAFYDPEGLTYLGAGKFALVEERYRIVNQFTYAPGTTLTKAQVNAVKLGTTVGNIGIEGFSYDPSTTSSAANPGFIVVKEKQPIGIFQTNINFAAGTASNGSASTANSDNLFNPALTGLLDVADVYALSNVQGIGNSDKGNLLLLSQESGKVIKTDRAGNLLGSLTIPLLSTSPLGTTVLTGAPGTTPVTVPDQQHEGLTMDDLGNLYLVSENGGGDINNPQLWVFAPVPEPESWAMMLAGFALVGLRRRARAAA